eukprot:scaffold23462_cov66-Phaeocystis_antarctica.AAC.3
MQVCDGGVGVLYGLVRDEGVAARLARLPVHGHLRGRREAHVTVTLLLGVGRSGGALLSLWALYPVGEVSGGGVPLPSSQARVRASSRVRDS